VNEFLEQCRREWRRLRVPDPVADEMAAEVRADLSEAGADGLSAEQLLGPAATDARSFAADWAAARGVIGERRMMLWLPVGIATLALIAAVGGALVMIDSPSPSKPVGAVWVSAPSQNRSVVVAAGPDLRLVSPQFARASVEDSGATRTVGAIMLFTGFGAIVVLTVFWFWHRRRKREPRPVY
jgi:hypothetical protein